MHLNPPKLFISYSWTDEDHETWVMKLAEELMSQGIDVILDKWNLLEGNDANAFMESMVTDVSVTKIIMICDRAYVEKSNNRSGGAGTEAQIISPELYKKTTQNKFVAVIKERDEDGKPYVPVYCSSNIHIDLSDSSTYSSNFENLLRWAWGKPLYIKPEIGKPPSFVTDESAIVRMNTTVSHRKAIDHIKNDRLNLVSVTREYLDTVASELEKFRISSRDGNEDEIFLKSIEDFLPYRNELVELFQTIASYLPSLELVEAVHKFFEKLIPFMYPPKYLSFYSKYDSDNFKFIIHELFIYCLGSFIKHEQFDWAAYFINNEYYHPSKDSNQGMNLYIVFRQTVKTLDNRNERLKLNRLSLRADILEKRSRLSSLNFEYTKIADFILYFRSRTSRTKCEWWPVTYIYMTSDSNYDSCFEMFSRSKSIRYFNKMKCLLDVKDRFDLEEKLQHLEKNGTIPQLNWRPLDIRALMAFDSIATVL